MPDTAPLPSGHVRLGSNSGQPMTRRDGILKVTGAATYAADNHPDGMLHAVYAASTDRPRPRRVARRRRRQGPSRRRRGDDPREPPAARPGPRRQARPVQLAHRGPAGRPRPLRRPADRPRRRRDPRGGDRRRAPARADLRGRARAHRLRRRRSPSSRRRSASARRRPSPSATSTPASPRPQRIDRDRHRDPAPVPQRHGAARHRRRLGRRPADHRHAEPGDRHGPGGLRRLLRHPGRERDDLRSPFLGGGFGSKAILSGPQILACLAARDARPAGQARLPPRPDVRPRRPPRRDPPAPAPRRGRATAG